MAGHALRAPDAAGEVVPGTPPVEGRPFWPGAGGAAVGVGHPDVYKLVHENDHFLVIEATWPPGQQDAMHSHLPAVIYWITDCQLNVDIPGGKRIEGAQKAGTSVANPAVQGHVAVNSGDDTCKALLVERK